MKLANRWLTWSGALLLTTTLVTTVQAEPLYAHESHDWDRYQHRDYRDDHHYRDYRNGRDYRDHHERYGRVIRVEPIYRAPRYEHCDRHFSDSRYRYDRGDRNRQALIGGVAGATIGNLIGREHGDATLGTVMGAAIGAISVDALGHHRVVQRCERHGNAHYDRSPVAYRVKYIYRGQIRMIQTRDYPGRFIRIDSRYRERG